jgi:phage terminase large subunit
MPVANEIEFTSRNDKQIDAAEAWISSVVEEILYGGAKGGGKSFLGAALIFGDALTYPETHYFIARRELIDLRNFTIPTIHEVFKKWGLKMDQIMSNGERLCTYNGQDHKFTLYNGSIVHLLACKDEPSDPLFERFGSMQMTRGWIEEGGEVPEAAKANLWLSIGRWKNSEYKLKKKLLITANPKKGWMKRDFVDPARQNLLPKTRRYIQAFATDNTYLPEDYVQSLANEKDSVRRERLYEGNWDYDDDKDSLTTYDALSDCFTNTIAKRGGKFMIVDVARKGRDTTVFSFWDDLELFEVQVFKGLATTETSQKVKDFAATKHIPFSHILVDEDGIGGGVVDQCIGVKGFTANSTPIDTAAVIRERQKKVVHSLIQKTVYANLKAQCGWKVAELINDHAMAFKVPDQREIILEELTAQLRDRTPDLESKKLLRAKASVKEELGRSPDVGDCVIMRAYFELIGEMEAATNTPQVKQAQEEQRVRFARTKKNRGSSSNK